MAYQSPLPAQLNLKLKSDPFNYVYIHLDVLPPIPHDQNQCHDFLPQIGPSCVSLSWIIASHLLCPPFFMNREVHSWTRLSHRPLMAPWLDVLSWHVASYSGLSPILPQGLTILAFLYIPENSASFSVSSASQPPPTPYLNPSILLLQSHPG